MMMGNMADTCRRNNISSYAPIVVIIMAALTGTMGCAPAFRANLDTRYAGEFVWPPPPEKPRITYLWSLYSFAAQGEGITDYITQEGGAGGFVDLPYMLKPYGIHAANDKLYIVDQGIPRVSVIDLKTQELLHFGFEDIGRLQMPIAIAVDNRGRMFVTDSEAATVNIYEPSGAFSGHLGDKGFFRRPTGIVVEQTTQRVYILDTAEHKVQVFDADSGAYRFSFGQRGSGNGEFNYPTHIASGADGRIYINDAMNFRIQIFDRDGRFIFAFGKQGDAYDDIDKPKGIAVDTFGHIYLVDTMQDMIKIFNDKGDLLLFFGGQGVAPGTFSMPTGISIDDHNRIYVADTYNHKIQAFKLIEEK